MSKKKSRPPVPKHLLYDPAVFYRASRPPRDPFDKDMWHMRDRTPGEREISETQREAEEREAFFIDIGRP